MNKQKLLDDLKKKMVKDESLPLREGTNNLVFGEGNSDADIMFIGEGPGYWEDMKGKPFVGNAGAFLNQMLLSINLPREDVFITNVVNYRPPANRDPEKEEIDAFQPYLDKMIEIINPKMIVTLGRFSMAKFLPEVKISIVHGKKSIITWKDRRLTVVPMYHPAAGLRNSQIKMQSMEDFKVIPQILNDYKEDEKKESIQEQMSLV